MLFTVRQRIFMVYFAQSPQNTKTEATTIRPNTPRNLYNFETWRHTLIPRPTENVTDDFCERYIKLEHQYS